MPSNRRKWPRKDIVYPAYIVLGPERRRCSVKNASTGGAKLEVHAPEEVPDDFVLCLSVSGPPCRKCHVVWREAGRIGVEWTGSVSKAECEGKTCRFECPSPAAADEAAAGALA